MSAIRNLKTADQIAFVFTEELVHHFWNIENETDVKLKVIEILQLINNKITKESVKAWGMNWT